MSATACPHAFPFRWHRNMARVIADEAVENGAGTCANMREALQKTSRNEGGTSPGSDHETCSGGSHG